MRRAFILGCLLCHGCMGDLSVEGSERVLDAGPPSAPADAGAGPRGLDAGGRSDAGPLPASDGGGPIGSDAGAGGSDLSAEERDLLDAINDERASQGLSPVAADPQLMCAARRHALDVGASGACGHVGSDGTWPWDRAMGCGFDQERWTVNEIAAGPGFRDGADAVSGWRQSSGHYAALTHGRAATVGVAVHNSCYIALFDCCVAGSE